MSTGCYMYVMNHWVLLMQSILHCMLTNLNLNKFKKKTKCLFFIVEGQYMMSNPEQLAMLAIYTYY